MQTQDSAAVTELIAPPVDHSVRFLATWKAHRGITIGTYKLTPRTQFLEDGRCPSFVIVNHDRDGNERLDLSPIAYDKTHPGCPREDKNGRTRLKKYLLPQGMGQPIFAFEKNSYQKFAAAREKWLIEGIGQTLAAIQYGLPALGLNGCEGGHLGGEDSLHPELRDINRGDVVNLVFDADARTNTDVREAAKRQMQRIQARGAIPYLRPLPGSPHDAHQGFDDWTVQLAREGKDVRAEIAKLPKLADLSTFEDFPFTSYSEMIARPFPVWVVEDVIPSGELTVIAGATSCGKTFLAMDLMMAVARGLPKWFDRDVNRTGLAVHISLEGRGLSNRFKAYKHQHNLTDPVPYETLERPLQMLEPRDIEKLVRSIRRLAVRKALPVAIITIDTVNRALGGGDENSSQDMGAFVRSADILKDAFPEAGILLIHHLGKNPERGLRGHSSFAGAVGADLRIDHNEPTKARTVSYVKMRDGTTDNTFSFNLMPVEIGKTDKGRPVTSCVVLQSAASVPRAEDDNRTRYAWMYRWYIGPENNRQPVSKRKITDNLGNIKPKDVRLRKADLEAMFEWAKNMNYATLAGDQPRKGEWYDLHSLPEPKY
jgi:hypothetical protein